MPPTATDALIAQEITRRIVRAGDGRVCTVALIGSRSLGTASATSDMDIVVIEELTSAERDWDGRAIEDEAVRLRRAVGGAPISIDLTLRTAEQFEEARHVFGGVEQLIENEGTVLFTRALARPATPRRSRENVCLALHRAWLDAALRSLAEAAKLAKGHSDEDMQRSPARDVVRVRPLSASGEHGATLIQVGASGGRAHTSAYYSKRAMQQALASLCVLHQSPSTKHDALMQVAERLEHVAPASTKGLAPLLRHEPTLSGAIKVFEFAITARPSRIQKDRWGVAMSRGLRDLQRTMLSRTG